MQIEDMPCFFLGANAPKGYFSRFDQLFAAAPEGKCYLLKGGPGTGKSTVLKKTAAVLGERGLSTELILCSADPDSLDAVMTFDGKFVMADATLPHSAEPKYPGVYETTVSLSDFWDGEKLFEHREKVIKLFDENRRLHEEARRYISAAANIFEEATKLGSECIDPEKVSKTAARICLREFGKKICRKGTEKQRFLSAVTGEGICFLDKTVEKLCDKVYAVEDECGAASRIFMNTVRKKAIEYGLDIIVCKCPVFPLEKTEHIIIPKLRLGFVTKNKRHDSKILPYRTIHFSRFADDKKYRKHKFRIRFALRLGASLIDKASECMKEAKEVHDELEKIYIKAMDFSKVDEKLEEIIGKI